ncbi:MAG TPA: peptide-methionine (R)-S-oxide reductase [Candidatus Poseidoniales archaeon]|nr:MAG TPA: peptide-methionine (R)-S-oxide reductase [Candidatus Poseidoniales archaeon]HII50770.1 peptide-methionine (R)-S-oxide reductase MsrB [Candidatus Poseidoniaceae archaeon]|tara:strand:- start:2546 stop:3688 length:1143 start_codon:yes stop_codon:yes gene_type:complete
MKIAVMALSGGMDSTSLLLRLLREGNTVYTIGFNYGQKHIVELSRAQDNIDYLSENGYKISHNVVDLSSLMSMFTGSLTSNEDVPKGHYEEQQMKSTVVPNRNAIFSSMIYGYALSLSKQFECNVSISLGVHSGDHAIYPDCRPEFYQSLNEAFEKGNWDSENVNLDLPYIDGDKESILRDAIVSCEHLGLDFDTIFANTNTSYDPDEQGRSSGKTGSDIERILAFHAIGRKDPVMYQQDWQQVLDHALSVEKEYMDKIYREKLTELQYQVTRNSATERAFTGIYDKHFVKGNYYCICCNHLLFSSQSKYNSGCGWPAFHSESVDANIARITDNSHGMVRIEVKCSKCDAHLGHVFEDGPKEYGGERYCINSAALIFKEE